ncbi:MAG: hypothetical protein EA351_03335 [Gemmatimonadales bacterium]|nr:MAG: hypothetical protein EA351_03335 [Gemmatimonadales bacterium]
MRKVERPPPRIEPGGFEVRLDYEGLGSLGERRGFLLPLAILGLLAVTALVMMSAALAMGLVRDTRLEREYLEGWSGPQPVEAGEIAVGWKLQRRLGPVASDSDVGELGVGRSSYELLRVIDPPREARLWTAPVYTPLWVAPTEPPGSAWAPSPCGGTQRTRASGDGPLLRFIGEITESLHPDGVAWAQRVASAGVVVSGPEVTLVEAEEGVVWLLSVGDVELRGDGVVRGILLAGGAVTLTDGAGWEGGVAAAGGVQVDSGSRIVGSWCAIEAALEEIPPPRRLDLPRGGALGRF